MQSKSSRSEYTHSQYSSQPFLTQQDMQTREPPIAPILLAQQSVLFPLYFFVPLWIAAINSIAAILVFYQIRQPRFQVNRWFKVGITLFAIAAIFIVYRKFSGKDAGIALITAMFGLKILETKTIKAANLLLSLSFFMMVASFLFSQSPLMAIYQTVPIVLVLNAFWAMQSLNNTQWVSVELTQVLKPLFKYLLLALPIMIILFVFFPRLSGPIWRMPGTSSSLSGISDSMSPGEISVLQLSHETAFRVKFDNQTPQQSELYWRVLTLEQFDGVSWNWQPNSPLNDNETKLLAENIENQKTFDYSLTLEPTRQNYVVVLDRPVVIPDNARLLKDFTARTRYRVLDRMRYSGTSSPEMVIDERLAPYNVQQHLQLPRNGNPRSRAWAVEERAKFNSDEAYIQSLLRHIHQDEFYYTLTPPIMERDMVDSFWFNFKRGFCEHYAGALVYLARAAGIPARVIIGYQGGERNTLADYWIVRKSNAHAWTEVWLKDKGWVRIDPTTAIASFRVEEGLLDDYSQRASLFDDIDVIELDNIGWIKNMEYWMDQFNNQWNEWILDYNSQRQQQFFDQFGFEKITQKQLLIGMIFAVFIFASFLGLKVLRAQNTQKPIAKAYQKLLHKLMKIGAFNQDTCLVSESELSTKGPEWLKNYLQAQKNPQFAPYVNLVNDYIHLRYQKVTDNQSREHEFIRSVNRI